MTASTGSRRATAVIAAVVLLFAAPLAAPAFSDHGNVRVYAVLDSPELFGSIDGGSVPATDSSVLFEAFDVASGQVVQQASQTAGSGVAVASFHLADGTYKIRATADGFQESWFTAQSGRDGGAFQELLSHQERDTFGSADAIVVDSATPENSSWNGEGWTVLHSTVSSISGAVASDSGGQPGTPLDGVVVELFDAGAAPESGPVLGTVTDNGYYTFPGLAPGSYKVRFGGGPAGPWWPETRHRAEAEVITLDGASHFNLAYAVFPEGGVTPDPHRALALSGQPALGATITAVPDFIDVGTFGVDCLQRYSWYVDDVLVQDAFGPTFVIPLDAGGKAVSARLDIAGLGCTYTALASDPVLVDPGLTPAGNDVVAAPAVDGTGAAPVTLTFEQVLEGGNTTVTRLDSSAAPPPGSFSPLTEPPLYYDIETDAVFSGALGVEVCITFDPLGMTDEQAAGQHLYHYVEGAWEDITVSSSTGRVCGVTDSFSPFAVGQPHWPFTGFLQPVDTGDVLNTMHAGAAVPLKFGLGGNRGLDILDGGAPSSSAIACPGATAPDDIEQTVAAGTSLLSYSADTDTYAFVWKTEKTWAGSCRQLELRLNDGTVHTAMFHFRK